MPATDLFKLFKLIAVNPKPFSLTFGPNVMYYMSLTCLHLILNWIYSLV